MSQLIRFSEQATIAIHAMTHLASTGPEQLATLKVMAAAYKVSEAHLAKVMLRLGKAGLVRAVRGPQGGYALSGTPEETTLLQVYEAIEGEVVPSACLFRRPVCAAGACDLGNLVCSLETRLRDYMARTSLSAMVGTPA
ncbi:MAG: Rrf2 family transcriptional regulator [Candidatus Sericytochromatia bacterium]|nr:Rrf2 family transcriptional regulator [Candidatus Tanganyikabacteria bacterium]